MMQESLKSFGDNEVVSNDSGCDFSSIFRIYRKMETLVLLAMSGSSLCESDEKLSQEYIKDLCVHIAEF